MKKIIFPPPLQGDIRLHHLSRYVVLYLLLILATKFVRLCVVWVVCFNAFNLCVIIIHGFCSPLIVYRVTSLSLCAVVSLLPGICLFLGSGAFLIYNWGHIHLSAIIAERVDSCPACGENRRKRRGEMWNAGFRRNEREGPNGRTWRRQPIAFL